MPWWLLKWSLPRFLKNITLFKNAVKDSLPMPRQYKQIHFGLEKISLFFRVHPYSISTYLSYLVTNFINNTSKIRNFDNPLLENLSSIFMQPSKISLIKLQLKSYRVELMRTCLKPRLNFDFLLWVMKNIQSLWQSPSDIWRQWSPSGLHTIIVTYQYTVPCRIFPWQLKIHSGHWVFQLIYTNQVIRRPYSKISQIFC